MPLSLRESPQSRRQTKSVTTGSLVRCDMHYHVFDELNDAVVRAFVEQNLPQAYENQLILDNYDLDPVDDCPGQWEVTAHFVLPQDSDEEEQGQPVAIQFSTVGGMETVKLSRSTITQIACENAGIAPDFKRAINVGDDGPEGVSIHRAELEFGLTYKVLANAIDLFALYRTSNKVNSVPWHGFAAGELLFLGVEGNAVFGDTGQLTYKFVASPNVTGQVVNGSQPFDKKGFEYVWFRYKKVKDAAGDIITSIPQFGYVEEIYEPSDFYELGIF